MIRKRTFACDEGNILVMSVAILALLIASSLGYMRWSSDERWDSAFEKATVQAYLLAQRGVIEQGLAYLRTRTPQDLPQGTVYLGSGLVKDVGMYLNTYIRRVVSLGYGDVFQRSDTYDIYSTGRATFKNHEITDRMYGQDVKVERTATMRARLRSFANYMYLTQWETTQYNEIIWFWSYDSLWGRTHSNDYIGLKYSPHFYGPISTSQDHFIYYQPQQIYFAYDPQFNVPPVYFPKTANTLRGAANPWISSQNGRYMTRLKARGGEGIEVHQYVLGTPPQDSLIGRVPPSQMGAVFVDGQCEIEGTITGNMTIGSSGDMWLIGDIRYEDANVLNGNFDWKAEKHMLGLVSESDILIANTWVNGRDNGWANGAQQNNIARHSIIITAGLVALGESFTFQHQNDDWEIYQGPTPDERGIIHLRGAVTQMRRGYVHRSNHGTGNRDGTGYGKDYVYDFRFDTRPPPFYLEAMDEDGFGLFDVVSWGEQKPTKH